MIYSKIVHLLAYCLFAFFISVATVGCSSKSPDSPKTKPADSLATQEVPSDAPAPNYSYSPNGLVIKYKSSANLNPFNGSSHTIVTVVYQLSNLNSFNDLAKTKEGLIKLLEAGAFDSSVAAVDKYIIHPNETKTINSYRAQNAQWVAIVAGYYELVPGFSTSTQAIPISYSKKGYWPFRDTVTKVEDLVLEIEFNDYSLQSKGYIYDRD